MSVCWSIQLYCKLQNILPIFLFYHCTLNWIWLMLCLHELKEALVLVKQFTSALSIETVLWSRIYLHGSWFSHSVVCKRRNLVEAFKFRKQSDPFSQMCNTRFYNTGTSDMNKSQSWSMPSLSYLGADLTWLDLYIWLSPLFPYLHSGETRCNLNKWCFWLLNTLNLLIKSKHKWLHVSQCVKQNSLREFSKKPF